jgi:hypothetical protein
MGILNINSNQPAYLVKLAVAVCFFQLLAAAAWSGIHKILRL